MKRKFRMTALLLGLLLCLTACGSRVTPNGQTEELANLLMELDSTDRYATVGFADYVFVGTVTDDSDNVLPRRLRDHEDYYTSYVIHVDEALKGDLSGDYVCRKMGGYKQDGTLCLVTLDLPTGEMIMDTGLPEQGKQYIFLANAQPDGSLTLSELFDNREFSRALREEYIDYVEHQIPCERERFVAAAGK